MDKSLRQTRSTFDFLHSSHMWIQTILSCGKNTAQQCSLGLFQDSDFAGEVNIRGTLVHIRKPHVRANKLDVQETKLQFRTVQQIQKSFPWTQD